MRFRNIQNWSDIDRQRGLLFFVQRLDELTYSYSLDSYKSPTTSLRGLVTEALDLINESLYFGSDRLSSALNSADHIISELKVSLRGNWIARRCITIDVDQALSLDVKNTTASTYIQTLTVLGADLDEELYIAEIVDQVISLASEKNAKVKLDLLAKELISTLQGRGMSRDHINQSISNFFFGNEPISNVSCLKSFSQIVYPHLHTYSVLMGADETISAIDDDSARRNNIELIAEDRRLEKFDSQLVSNFRQKNNSTKLLMIKIRATDYSSAVLQAKKHVDNVSNFYRVFSHKSDFNLGEYALVEQACCEGLVKEVAIPQNHMHFIRDMRQSKASSVFKRFDERITIDVGPDTNKFMNIVNIHGLSLSLGNSDIQLVNLWTCLETMSPSDGFSSNVSTVVRRLMPVLMLGYYNRLVVNLLFDILRWDRRGFTESMKLAKIDGMTDIREKFVSLLSSSENEPALGDLYTRCRDFELLRYRIYTISKLLKSPKAAKEKLELHADMVKWQLYRIYRTRNRIVHAGDSPQFTNYLVENAHDFFDISLMFCMELSAWKQGFDTFHACFGYADTIYRNYLSHIDSASPSDIVWTLPRTKDKSFIFGSGEEEGLGEEPSRIRIELAS